MAHERITGDDVAGDIIVHWTDEGMLVDLGMIWDEPKSCSEIPATDETGWPIDSAATSATASHPLVVERRVEGGPGGMIEVPVAAYDAATPDGPSEPTPLRAWLDNEGRWSIYMTLDRPKLNGLIRTLRRARNKAFGADE